jgi:CO/xanthine dehydrogenase FAD-binding subunit
VDVEVPRTLDEAVAAAAAHPGATLLAGGTDVMVEINFGRLRPDTIVVVRGLPELRGLERNGRVVARAGVTYTELLREPGPSFAAVREMARTVGSPQIRNAGTIGGNLGTSSPAGDALPVLAAFDVLVDGTVVGRYSPNRAASAYWDAWYDVPAALVRGKTKITVRFQAAPDSRVVPIYGVRIVRAAEAR